MVYLFIFSSCHGAQIELKPMDGPDDGVWPDWDDSDDAPPEGFELPSNEAR